MAKTFISDEDYTISETGNWNVADSFAKFKIMKPIINCEIYEDGALYGFDSFFDELTNSGISTDELRVRSLNRLINELIRLTKNTMFAMKKTGTKENMQEYQKSLRIIREKILPHTYEPFINESTKKKGIALNNKLFDKVVEIVGNIKSKINDPLNKNHLIFVDKQEFDPKAFKDKIRERIINKG